MPLVDHGAAHPLAVDTWSRMAIHLAYDPLGAGPLDDVSKLRLEGQEAFPTLSATLLFEPVELP